MSKRLWWLLLSLLPALAHAGPRQDYARQWPLQTDDAQAGAYRVILDESVYRSVQRWDLADLDVIDAQGRVVPSALFEQDEPAMESRALDTLPWFDLPPVERVADVAAISEIATDGSVRRVQWQRDPAQSPSAGVLIDASRLGHAIHALRLQWRTATPLDASVRLQASDNLRDWHTLDNDAQLVDLRNAQGRVLQDRISFASTRARYLRVIPHAPWPADFQLVGVQGESTLSAPVPVWQWLQLNGKAVTTPEGGRHFEFDMPGRFPVARVDAELPGNSSQEWRLASRDAAEQPWREVAGPWVAFRLQAASGPSASPPQPIAGPNRDHQWRLTALRGVGDQPQLKLGWQPEMLVFVAQGQPPFALVAGSARARRADAPVLPMMEAIRAERGVSWQPAMARLGAAMPLAGDEALQAAPKQRDWKAWLLWGLLIVGALLVTGLALSLMRKPAARD